jgi:hypothetical protein
VTNVVHSTGKLVSLLPLNGALKPRLHIVLKHLPEVRTVSTAYFDSMKLASTEEFQPDRPNGRAATAVCRIGLLVAALILAASPHRPLMAQTTAPATLSSPTPATVLAGSTVTFKWTAGTGVTAYFLSLGTTGPSSANLWESGSITTTSVTATGLPTTGAKVYATLFSMINGAWVTEGYTFTEATQTPATLTSPQPGSAFTGTSVAFSWAPSSQATAYFLSIGTTGPGSANLWESGSITATSATVTGLPITGVTIYATLFSKINGIWNPEHYTFTAAVPTPAKLTAPASGSVLPGTSAKFSWTTGVGVTAYFLSIGTTGPTSANVWESGSITATSATATGLPITGATVNVTLFSMINGAWKPVEYTFTAAAPTPAALISPVPGSTFTGTSAKFTWTAGTGVTAYFLSIGTNGPTSANVWESGSITATSATATGLPMTGATVNVTLFSMINGVWKSVGYTFVAGSDATYQVNLAWIAPVDSPVTIAGYNVYRAPSGSSIYEQVNPSVTDATTFIDTNVTSGDAYDYYIESVTSAGVSSAPSAVLGISIP